MEWRKHHGDDEDDDDDGGDDGPKFTRAALRGIPRAATPTAQRQVLHTPAVEQRQPQE